MRPSASAVGTRLALLCAAVLAGSPAPGIGEEEVLLSLPRDFDVTVLPPGQIPPGYKFTPLVFRFRGETVTGTMRYETVPGTPPMSRNLHTGEFEGTFHRGHLAGRFVSRGVQRYYRTRDEFSAEGTATADGRLALRFRLLSHNHRALYADGGWRDRTSEIEGLTNCSWDDIVLQLPVGELQSSRDLAAPPLPVREPRSAAGVSPPVPGGADRSAGDAGVDPGPGAVPDAPSGETDRATDPRVGVFDGEGSRSGDSPWSVPVTPDEAAGAGVAVALTSLLGALWMFGTSGLSPGDLLGSAPEVEALEPPSAEAPPPREAFVESHRDGDVRPDTGEVWSESVGGWVGENFHEIERRHQAEVRRAQDVSDRESRRESARIAEELRASRQREEAAARRGAEAAEDAAWLEAPTIEPYQPGWTDHMTKGLEWAEWGTDTSMSVLGSLTGPAGETGGRVYTVAKETLKGLSEGVADYVRGKGGHLAGEGSAWVIVERGTIGATKGAAKVGLDKVTGDLMNGAGEKLAGSAASEGAQALVRTVVDQLDSPAAVETCRSVSIAVGKALAGSEMVAPVNKGIKAVTGEDM